jgi:hypothetical protein
MRGRLHIKSKPNNYTESCMVDVTDIWREKTCGYPGRSVWNAPKGVTTVQGNEAVLNIQKSTEVIVAERRRTESIGVPSITEKGPWKKPCPTFGKTGRIYSEESTVGSIHHPR